MTNRYADMIEAADTELREANARVRAAHRAKARIKEESLNAALLDLGRKVAAQEGLDFDPKSERLDDTLARLAVLIDGEDINENDDTSDEGVSEGEEAEAEF